MKIQPNLLSFAILIMLGTANVYASTLVAYWNFNNVDNPSATSGTGTLNVTQGSGSLTWSGNDINALYFAGTVTNMLSGDSRGLALALQNGTTGENNGAYLEFTLNLEELEDLTMSFAGQRTSSGFTTIDVSWAVGSGSFTSIASINDLPSSFGTTTTVPGAIRTVDFASVNESIGGETDVKIRMSFTGGDTGSATGNNRLDNIVFTAVPEPSTALLGAIGLAALLRRRR